jgi:UDP-3-O-[3-hydroxymyristoyl] glucosamine N-acyltransferase
VLGSDGFGFEFSGGKHVKIPQTGIVQVEDDVEIGANTTIDRARFGRTWIQEGTKIDNLVQIAHNVVIGKHCIIVSQAGISGSTRLGNYVTLAGQVGIVGHIEIGDQAIVGAQSGVSKSIGPKEVWFGYPAMPMRESKEQLARIARLPKLIERVKRLEQFLGEREKSLPPESERLSG